jgi:hypothetical protein
MATPDQGNPAQRREAIRRRLAAAAGGCADAGAVAAAASGVWRQVTECLAPMIGARGVDALLGRSLQLTAPAFPWLARVLDQEDGRELLANVQARLAARDPNAAAEASLALLVAFTELLATLIGASLTDRLLDPVWGGAGAPESKPEARP